MVQGVRRDGGSRLTLSSRIRNLPDKRLFLRRDIVHLNAVGRTGRRTHHVRCGVDRHSSDGAAEGRSDKFIGYAPARDIEVDEDGLRMVVCGRHVGMVHRRILRDEVGIVDAIDPRRMKNPQNLVARDVRHDEFEMRRLGDVGRDRRGDYGTGIDLLIGDILDMKVFTAWSRPGSKKLESRDKWSYA